MTRKIITDTVEDRKNKVIARLLYVKERYADPHLPDDASDRLRKTILGQLNEFSDYVLELFKTIDSDDVIINELYLNKLDEMHESVSEIRRMMRNGSP